jgi:very-short-patch-repair endonuclease
LTRALLDQVRRRRAVAFDFFQSYLNPNSMPWVQLTAEPYNVVFPERELGPVSFMRERGEAARNRPGGTTFFPFFKDTDKGGPGVIPKLVGQRAGLGCSSRNWTHAIIELLADRQILAPVKPKNSKAREAMGRDAAWQIDPRFIRLHPAREGWRCQKCQTWRPYLGLNCYGSSRCKAEREDLLPASVRMDRYYERLYLDEVPRRLKAREHTAQISQDDRAALETDFKDGKVDVLVCSLSADAGQLRPASWAGRAKAPNRILDKNLIRDFLFHIACGKATGLPKDAVIGTAAQESVEQMKLLGLEQMSQQRGLESHIEQRLLEAIRTAGLPEPVCQFAFHDEACQLITIADFAYPDHHVAIYCDGYAWHGTAEKLAGDAQKRNHIQSLGWRVLTFWGRTILAYPDRCARQIANVLQAAPSPG